MLNLLSTIEEELKLFGQKDYNKNSLDKRFDKRTHLKRFLIALSFPGEQRKIVEDIAFLLSEKFGEQYILYDKFHEAEFARPNLATHLQHLYHNESVLIVVFLCTDYEHKEWPGLEWRAIQDLINRKQNSSIMFIKLDDSIISGFFSTIDGYIEAINRSSKDIAELIIKRLDDFMVGVDKPTSE